MLWTEYLCSPRFLCWNCKPHVMVSGGEFWVQWLDHGCCWALMFGRNALMKETSLGSPLTPLCIMWGHSKKSTLCNWKRSSPEPHCAGTLISGFQDCETKLLLFPGHQSVALRYGSWKWLQHVTVWFPVWQASFSASCFYHIMFLQVVAHC